MAGLKPPSGKAPEASGAASGIAADDSAMGAFARLVGLLRGGEGAAKDEPALRPLRQGGARWIAEDGRPDEVWASIWFPAAPAQPVTAASSGTGCAVAGRATAPTGAERLPATAKALVPAGKDGAPPACHASRAAAGATAPATPGPATEEADLGALVPTSADPAASAGTAPAGGTPEATVTATAVETMARATAQAPGISAAPADAGAAAAAVLAALAPDTARRLETVRPPIEVLAPQAPARIAEQVTWSVADGLSEVRLQLTPDDLGAIDVHLRLDGDRVHVAFHAADAGVRDVVQTSLPNLSAMLSARGLQLHDAQVYAGPRTPDPAAVGLAGGTMSSEKEERWAPALRRTRRIGLLDDYV